MISKPSTPSSETRNSHTLMAKSLNRKPEIVQKPHEVPSIAEVEEFHLISPMCLRVLGVKGFGFGFGGLDFDAAVLFGYGFHLKVLQGFGAHSWVSGSGEGGSGSSKL